jgi:metal-sulfur cluster biosynthetic enzyme
MLLESDILLALRNCYDPVLPCNIVDLGLIRSISITPDSGAPGSDIPGVPERHKIQITLTPTSDDEAAHSQLEAQIVNRLAGVETISHTIVIVLQQPAWTPQSITPAGRKTLGLDGNPNLIQIR